jgi:hypothetical protein
LNKLAVLAFALLIFFSTMLWYLANGSLNEYLKSQVLLQSQYYSGQKATLLDAKYKAEDGVAYFNQLTLANIEGASQPLLLSVGKITAQLAKTPAKKLNNQSIQTKATTIITIEKLLLSNVNVWSEMMLSGEESLEQIVNDITMQLASDYPALYPEISAKIYAEQHPELNEKLAVNNTITANKKPELNQAVMQAKQAKQQKRLLGKAQTRVIISSVIIEDATFNRIIAGQSINRHFKSIDLGRFGDKYGLDSNQLGGELLKAIISQLQVASKYKSTPHNNKS